MQVPEQTTASLQNKNSCERTRRLAWFDWILLMTIELDTNLFYSDFLPNYSPYTKPGQTALTAN